MSKFNMKKSVAVGDRVKIKLPEDINPENPIKKLDGIKGKIVTMVDGYQPFVIELMDNRFNDGRHYVRFNVARDWFVKLKKKKKVEFKAGDRVKIKSTGEKGRIPYILQLLCFVPEKIRVELDKMPINALYDNKELKYVDPCDLVKLRKKSSCPGKPDYSEKISEKIKVNISSEYRDFENPVNKCEAEIDSLKSQLGAVAGLSSNQDAELANLIEAKCSSLKNMFVNANKRIDQCLGGIADLKDAISKQDDGALLCRLANDEQYFNARIKELENNIEALYNRVKDLERGNQIIVF